MTSMNGNNALKNRLEVTLQRIAVDVVDSLGYVGSMIAILEDDGALPVYAFHIDPHMADMKQIGLWEERISAAIRRKVSISDPEVARVYINDRKYQGNLSVRAVKEKKAKISHNLLDLFVPIVPSTRLTRPIMKGLIQPALGIQQVIAVPFFLDALSEQEPEVVGNLFAAKSSEITNEDILVLTAFGRHAAATIEIERQRVQVIRVARHLTTEIQTRIRQEEAVLQQIAEGVVKVLGYAGAMVATYEADDSLPVRAFYVNPKLASMEQIASWEDGISRVVGKQVSISDPNIAKVYVNKSKYEENLSVQAVRKREPVVSDELLTLFTPIVPSNLVTRKFINSVVQKFLKISQVVAIPFFLEAPDGSDPQIVGNLFTATTHPEGFQNEEIELLQAFGQQAAAGIFNAQLYQEINEQRQVAQVFGMMAFSASKSIHQFRNHIGAIRGQLQLLPYLETYSKEERQNFIATSLPKVIERLDIVRDLLDQLHEPWRSVDNKLTNVNVCLKYAKDKIVPLDTLGNLQIGMQLSEDLPLILTSPDMLTEAFSILIKNAIEAINEKGHKDGYLSIDTVLTEDQHIKVQIEDNGSGIKEENKNRIFQMRWSTKASGLGFGLFWTRDFIKGLGGRIEVESKWQEGTTFIVYIPIKVNQQGQ